MSKKIDLTNSINTIDDGGLNTANEVRNVLNDLKNNAYGDVINEINTSLIFDTTNTTRIDIEHSYNCIFVKQGRRVTVIGNIKNYITPSSIVSNEVWFNINAGDFSQYAEKFSINAFTEDTGELVKCSLLGNAFTVVDAIAPEQTITFNFQYFTQD
jgi:hypothetical protein